jgi:hypothetical protein
MQRFSLPILLQYMKRVMTAPSRLFMVSAATASITSCGERAMPVAKGGPLGIAHPNVKSRTSSCSCVPAPGHPRRRPAGRLAPLGRAVTRTD